MNRRAMLVVLSAAALAAGARAALAAEPILTLRGPAGPDGGTAERAFDLGGLDAMTQTSFSTGTPWHSGVVAFSGVALKDLLASTGTKATTLRLTALNDYVVEADAGELLAADALLATRQDGQTMPISDKGPVFLVFPFDGRSELKHQSYYSRCVWQLTTIDIVT